MSKKITVELHEEDGKWYVPYDRICISSDKANFYYQGRLVTTTELSGRLGFNQNVELSGLHGRVELVDTSYLFPLKRNT